MDGVLADFLKGVSKELGIEVTNDEVGHRVYDKNKAELTAKHIFRNLEPMPDMWKLLGFVNNLGIHTEVLSAAGSVNREIVVNDKIGWVKDGEQEYAYSRDNYLWSALWDDSFTKNDQYKIFQSRVRKFGYDNVRLSIYEEVPSVIELKFIQKYFTTSRRNF